MAHIEGARELSKQLSALGKAAGGKALRAATMQAMLPALQEAKKSIPVGEPPFESGKDPYPVRTYKGRLRTPGFARRNLARKSKLSRDGRRASAMLSVKPEAFYVINFNEFGTSRRAKRPWLEPAFRRALPAINARLKERLKKQLDKAAR